MKDVEFSLAKTKKISKNVHYLFKVLFYLILIYIIGLVFFGIASIVAYDSISTISNASWADFFQAAISQIPILLLMRFISLLLSDVSKGKTPFSKMQVSRLKYIGIFFLVDALFVTLLSPGFFNILISGGLEVGTVVSNKYLETLIPIELSSILLALVAFSLALVFKYGIQLQRQSEEIV